MKNLMNRVLVVLTVTAVFAGNIGASQPMKKSTQLRMQARAQIIGSRETLKKMSFFDRVSTMGADNFDVWTMEDRTADLINQYGSLEKAPKSVKLFLLGSATDTTTKFRMTHRVAALKALSEIIVPEATKNLEETTKQLKADPENKDLQAKLVQDQTTLEVVIAKMKSYATPKTATAAGIAIVTGLALYYDVCGSYTFLASHAGNAYKYLASTRVGEFVGSGVGMARRGLNTAGSKAYAVGQAGYSGAKYYGQKGYNAVTSAPATAAMYGSSLYGAAKNRFGYGQPQPDMKIEQPMMEPAYNPEM